MRKFIVTLLFLTGLVLAGLAYSCYSEYRMATNLARFYRIHADEVPTLVGGESREQYIAGELRVADRNRNQAMLSGAGSLLLLTGGAVLLVRNRRKETFTPASADGLNEDPVQRFEAMNRWASVALTRPIKVQFIRSYSILFAFVIVFFTGISLLVIVVNGFTSTSVLILILNALMLFTLYYMVSRAQRKSASLFDSSGVTRRDNRRFNWSELQGVNYMMARRPRSGKEYLWRIEIVFNSDNAWIIPQRIKNWDEINSLIAALPVTHQQRPI